MKKINFFRYCMMMAVALFAGATLIACGDDDEPTPPVEKPVYEDPAVKVIAGEVTSSTITFTVESTDATALAYTVVKKGGVAPTPADLLTKGTQLEALASQAVTVEELSAETTYCIYAAVTNDGGKQVMSEAVEMITDKKKVETETPEEGDNYIQLDGGAAEKILYAIYDTNGGANYTFNFTSSNLVDNFLDLRDIATCPLYVSISPTPPDNEIGAEAVNVANGNYGYIRITENTSAGGGYQSWFSMPGDGSGSSGTVSVKLLDAATEEYEVTLDASIAPYFKAETPRKVKLYYKGVIKDEATEEGEDPGNGSGGSDEEMVPLPEGNAFIIDGTEREIKSVVYEADPANDMMWNVYLCTAEGITTIDEAEQGEYLFCYIDSTSSTLGAPMILPSNLGVYIEYYDADGNVAVQWLPSDVDYTGELNASLYEMSGAPYMSITCQTTNTGGLAIKYNGVAAWDDRYFEGTGGTEIVQ